jgi:hypothetical protein
MKRIILLFIGVSISILSFTQTTLNFHPTMFNNLTTSKLSTNVLADKAGIPDLFWVQLDIKVWTN